MNLLYKVFQKTPKGHLWVRYDPFKVCIRCCPLMRLSKSSQLICFDQIQNYTAYQPSKIIKLRAQPINPYNNLEGFALYAKHLGHLYGPNRYRVISQIIEQNHNEDYLKECLSLLGLRYIDINVTPKN